jgi:hypothetical protein
MKKIILLLLTVSYQITFSQTRIDTIDVPFDKTAKLIFPDSITFDDIGTSIFKSSKTSNRYLIYSEINKPGYESSLYIELPSGHYYEFVLRYNNNPKQTVYPFSIEDATGINPNKAKVKSINSIPQKTETKKEEPKQVEVASKKDSVFTSVSEVIMNKADSYSGIGENKHKTIFWLNNIYVKEDKIYIKISAQNQSSYAYDISKIRFAVGNKESVSKKSTVSDLAIEPLFCNQKNMMIDENGSKSFVYVFDKFTIGNKKFLHVEMWEKSGERDMSFKISSKNLLKAKQLH